MDRYITPNGSVIGNTLDQAVAWAQAHPETFSVQNIYLDMGDGEPWLDADADIQHELTRLADDAKPDVEILRESLALLNTRVTELAFEMSKRLEALEK